MDLDILSPWIKSVALKIYRSYSSWVTRQDLESELWAWALKNESRILEYQRNGSDFERIIRAVLNKEARAYAIRERAAMSGYDSSDLEWYTPRSIRAVLPLVFDHEDWNSYGSAMSSMPSSKPTANATGDMLATIVDIKSAMESLFPEQQQILRMFYGAGVGTEVLALTFDINEEAARKRIDRAVYAIADRLNNPRQGDPYEATNGQWDTRSHGRRAMSNARARKVTNSGWGE